MKILKKLAERLPDIFKDSDELYVSDNISIGITTFGNRFDRYFVPLLSRIKEYVPTIEVIVAINGEHQQEFDENYRRRILEFIAGNKKVYPLLFPHFRGLAKLWNSIIINASGDYILMLNDDIMINDSSFLKDMAVELRKNRGRSFLINKSWSHFLISRREIDELGYFDERLLGIGEEDGDITWRYQHHFGREIKSLKLKYFINYAEETVNSYKPTNIKTHADTKYSLFNRKFMFGEKYCSDPAGIKGMFDEPVRLKDPGKKQYPYERFYHLHKKEL